MAKLERPDWFPTEQWEEMSEEERQFVVDDPEAAKEALDEARAEAEEAEEVTKSNKEAEAKKAMLSASPTRQHTLALEAASRISENREATEAIDKIIEAGVAAKNGPVRMLVHLIRTEPNIADWPEPGSSAPESNNPDKYETIINGTKVRSSFYKDFVEALPQGKRNIELMEAAKKAADPAKHDETVPEEMKKWGRHRCVSFYQTLKTRQTMLRSLVITTVRLYQQFQRAKEYKGAIIELIGEEETISVKELTAERLATFKLSNSMAPIIVAHPSKRDEYSALKVSQFLTLDFETASRNGETFDSLLKTIERGRKEKPEIKGFSNLEEGTEAIVRLAAWLESSHAQRELRRILQLPKSDAMLLALHDVYEVLDDVVSKHAKRIELLLAKRNAQEEAEENEKELKASAA